MLYELFTDGSCNLQYCGWGFVLQNSTCEIQGCGFDRGRASNRMELLAVIKGLEKIPGDCTKVNVYTDSLFVIKGRPKSSRPIHKLWLRFYCLAARHETTLIKIGPTNKHPTHKRAHYLAREAVFNHLIINGDFNVSCSPIC